MDRLTPALIGELAIVADIVILGGLVIRVIMRRRPVGFQLAWIAVLLGLPLVGIVLYVLLGEMRLGRKRALRAESIHGPFQNWLGDLHRRTVQPVIADNRWRPLSRLAESAVGIPPLPGNMLELLPDADAVFKSLIADIDNAKTSCHLEFYIWHPGGRADELRESLVRAVKRGVTCRVLLDDVGSRDFLRSDAVDVLRSNGVAVTAALPSNLLRMFFVRFDLRLHRKIVVIDGEIGYTGSLNLVDPRFFKQDAGVGQWIDAMVRVHGPAVEALAITFLEDWELETEEGIEQLRNTADVRALPAAGPAPIQVLPSGPVYHPLTIHDVLMMVIYTATEELILTSPYYVPDEPLQAALISAARRGVTVTLIVPAKEDSIMVRYASQAYRGDLVAAGVRVLEFHGGLLHTKSVTVDGQISLFGSLNLDPRSFYLNFEITLAIYDAEFTSRLRALQLSYARHCQPLDLASWRSRSALRKLAQNTFRLMGPLL